MSHPLKVAGSASENRWSQTKHELFSPLPIKLLTVSPSGSGKSSILLAVANILFEHMTYWAIFSHSWDIDPAFAHLVERIRESYKAKGLDEASDPLFCFLILPSSRRCSRRSGNVSLTSKSKTPLWHACQCFAYSLTTLASKRPGIVRCWTTLLHARATMAQTCCVGVSCSRHSVQPLGATLIY